MIRRLLARLIRPKPAKPDLDVLIAKRGLRLHNRSGKEAAKYERIHTILAEGHNAEIRRQS